ncbi:MAG: ergothioneine biosynthesis protein EgtB [Oceanicoccus sp.]|jgi:ergothioneine biosynthesis protein EgtB
MKAAKDCVADNEKEQALTGFLTARKLSEMFCQPLETEDYGLQAMAETSPAKWHLAHTTWFFETFILKHYEADFFPFQPAYEILFNSYYNSVGEQFSRAKRALLSRPTVADVYQYRNNVSDRVARLIKNCTEDYQQDILALVTLGINHEQQHQELFFTDLKYNFFQNPLAPTYSNNSGSLEAPQAVLNSVVDHPKQQWLSFDGGLIEIGAEQGSGFIFDNEGPLHQHFLTPFEVSSRLVTNAEYMAFIDDSGYQRSELWLSDGWDKIKQQQWQAPLYWQQPTAGQRMHFTLNGLQPIDPEEPVSHISAYEADAFARWCKARLLTEFEWEHVAKQQPTTDGNFVESGQLKAVTVQQDNSEKSANHLQQLFGDLWEWTSSAYQPYPGFVADEGAVGEYNGKFMCNQLVLRGGSCVTSQSHIRNSYRNFFYPETRWQFSGIRLAR